MKVQPSTPTNRRSLLATWARILLILAIALPQAFFGRGACDRSCRCSSNSLGSSINRYNGTLHNHKCNFQLRQRVKSSLGGCSNI